MKMKRRMFTLLLAAIMVLSYIQVPSMAAAEVLPDNEPIESTFTDAAFLTAVREVIGKTDGEHIYRSDVENITALEIQGKKIANLDGIQHFTSLKELYCWNNDLLELDLSYNPNLEVLDCSFNIDMESLTLSNCFKLKSLDCNYTALQDLDVSKNPDLTSLVCYSTKLSSLDISNNLLLETLDVYDAHLVTLDITNNIRLTSLDCSCNDMCAVDSVVGVENCTLLQEDDAFVFEPQNVVERGHSWNSGVVTAVPTCGQKGELTYACTHCGITKTEDIAATGQDAPDADHSWGSGVVTVVPTCIQKGEMTYTCTSCGKTKTEEIAATGQDAPDADHSWDSGVVTITPTCTQKGETTYTCTNCGKTRTEDIAVTEHNYSADWKSDETNHWHGCVCGEIMDKSIHVKTWDKDSSYHWEKCNICGWVNTAKTDHVYDDAQDTTCNICSYERTVTPPVGPVSPISPAPPVSGGSSYDYYIINATTGEGGSITPNGRVSVRENKNQAFTIIPDEGYAVADVLVDGKSVGAVIEYTFEKVSKSHTIKVTFRESSTGYKACLKNEICPIWPYTDASTTAWYHNGVHYCIENELMSGYGSNRFGPNDTLTRGMLVQILYNKADRPAVSGDSPFDDMAPNAWYIDAMKWAAANGIVEGYGNDRFGPDDPITREQLAVMLWRYADSPAISEALNNFVDKGKASEYALNALRWAVKNGIMYGKNNGVLDPRGNATRAEVAAMLQRYMTSEG